MSTADPRTTSRARDEHENLNEISFSWTVFSGLGALTIVLGLALILSTFFLNRATVLVSGWLMVAIGAAQLAGSYAARRWIGSVAAAINGVLYGIIGIVLFSEHLGDAMGLMLAVAGLVFTVGLARIGVAMMKTYTHREISLFNGAFALLIAGMILGAWYGGLVWGVGLLLGIEVIMTGVAWIAFSLVLRQRGEVGTS